MTRRSRSLAASYCPSASSPAPTAALACGRGDLQQRYAGAPDILQTFYGAGIRVRVRLEWPGVIIRFCLAPANVHELAALPALAALRQAAWLVAAITGRLPLLRNGAPYPSAKRGPHPRWSVQLSRVRYSIDTVFGQLVDWYAIKRIYARDLWHPSSRLLRKVLMHTAVVHLNVDPGNLPLQLAQVIAS